MKTACCISLVLEIDSGIPAGFSGILDLSSNSLVLTMIVSLIEPPFLAALEFTRLAGWLAGWLYHFFLFTLLKYCERFKFRFCLLKYDVFFFFFFSNCKKDHSNMVVFVITLSNFEYSKLGL